MEKRLYHPKMLAGLGRFFPLQCTILHDDGASVDDHGAPVSSWEELDGHILLACDLVTDSGEEIQRPGGTVLISTHRILLQGYYPEVTERMRVLIEDTDFLQPGFPASLGDMYEILRPDHDANHQLTRLICQMVR
jgi:hypothetical protein